MAQATKPQVQQFKNAFHMFKNPTKQAENFQLEFSPQKIMRKDAETHSQISLFGPSPLARHFKDKNFSSTRSKSSLEGLGITVDDSGNFLVAEWRNNQIEGKYFLFKPNTAEEGDKGSTYSAICMYGSMRGGNLDGESYAYNITGSLAKAAFENGKITGKCYIIHNNKLFVADEANKVEKIDCEVINNETSGPEAKNSSNVLKIPKISVPQNKQGKSGTESSKFASNFEQVQANTFIKPNKFLEDLIVSYQRQGDKKGESLVYTGISQRQFFLGFLQTEKNDYKQSSLHSRSGQLLSKINGFGVMLKNQWPNSYGTYKEGKLEGLGRIYETQMNLFDGYFSNGELMEGFIIDYFANTTSFGHQSSIDSQYKSQSHQENCFIITDTFETLSCEYLTEYKKSFHLKSLNFNNSYFNSPKLIHRSPWPYNIINKLTRRPHIDTIIKSFRPTFRDVEISEIEKIGHSSENRVEKMLIQEIQDSGNPTVREESMVEKQQLLKQKSNFIKSEIERNLKEKEYRNEENSKQNQIVNYVKEYKRLERRRTEIILEQKPKPKKESSVDKNVSELNHPPTPNRRKPSAVNESQPAPSTPTKRLALTPIKLKIPSQQPSKEQDLTQLVQEYEQCETERKNSVSGGNTTRRTNTDRKATPRQLYSKHELMQQDFEHFQGKEKASPAVKAAQGRRKVDLDLIYRQYLHK